MRRRAAAIAALSGLALILALAACAPAGEVISPLAGRWVSELGQRVYQIDNDGTLDLGTLDYPFSSGATGTWKFRGKTLSMTWGDGSAESFTVSIDGSIMNWTSASPSITLTQVGETAGAGIKIKDAATDTTGYDLGLSEQFSTASGTSAVRARRMYRSSLYFRGYSKALVTMIQTSDDGSVVLWDCSVYLAATVP